MVTRKDVAKKAGVSTATVSNVLEKRLPVSDKVVERVMSAVRELNYIPNRTARSLSLGRSNNIGIIVSEFTNPFSMEIVRHIESYAAGRGFMVTIFDMRERDKDDAYRYLRDRQFDAIINFSFNIYSKKLLNGFCNIGTKMINFTDVPTLSLMHDYYKAMEDAMRKLHELGHKKVGYISTMDKERWLVDERGKCFIDNREKYGFEANDDYLIFNDDYSRDSNEIGYSGCKKLFENKRAITALFVTNDLAAMGAIRALKDMGLRCPENVSVIGCDNITISELFVPSISTISFDKEAFGTSMAEKIIDWILNGVDYAGKVYNFETRFIARESIAPLNCKE